MIYIWNKSFSPIPFNKYNVDNIGAANEPKTNTKK